MPVPAFSSPPVACRERPETLRLTDRDTCSTALEVAEAALAAHLAQPGDADGLKKLALSLRDASDAVARLPRQTPDAPVVSAARKLVRKVCGAGVLGQLSEELGEASVDAAAQKKWPGLLARMLIQPAWRASDAPTLDQVPDWLWGDYAAWLFTAPLSFRQIGEAEDYAAFALRRMEELARWVGRNVGSPAVRGALDSYLAHFSFLSLTVSTDSLKRHAELHGRILTAGLRPRPSVAGTTTDRTGRPLRIAFVASTPAAIPAYSRLLDPERFEISLYVLEGAEEANEKISAAALAILSLLQSGNRTRQFQSLAATLAEQLSELESAGLDVVVFPEELAASNGQLHRLAMHRLAPLHVFTDAAVSTGLPTADVLVLGETEGSAVELADQFTERLAIRPGTGLLLTEISAVAATRTDARAALRLPENAYVIMTAARAIELTPALRQSCVEMLRSLPNAFFAVQLLHVAELPAGAVDVYGAEWDKLLTASGIATDRVLVLAGVVESQAALQSVIAAADVFLDVGAFAEPDLLNVPLSLQIPIVTLEGRTLRSRRGAGLLRTLGLDRLIARSEAHRCEIVRRLATQPDDSAAIAGEIRAHTERLPLCHDQLAVVESLGFVLEQAYDQLHVLGRGAFRSGNPLSLADRQPPSIDDSLALATDALAAQHYVVALARTRDVFCVAPAHPAARCIAGRANLALNRFACAVDYLLAAVQASDDPTIWFDLAVALDRNAQRKEAVQALETSLRLDASRTDAWAMLVELASELGAYDIAREALAALVQLAPLDPRVATLEQGLRVG